MAEWQTLTPGDTDLAQQIIEASYEAAHDINILGLVTPGVKTPEVIGISGVCIEMSDIATRMAHGLGIVATRERHQRGSHHITSFGPLGQEPSEEDLILCLTWGQFNQSLYRRLGWPYFGPRHGIEPYITHGRYRGAYSSSSVLLRQTLHRPPRNPGSTHVWPFLEPEELEALGNPLLGELPLIAAEQS